MFLLNLNAEAEEITEYYHNHCAKHLLKLV